MLIQTDLPDFVCLASKDGERNGTQPAGNISETRSPPKGD